MQYLQKGKANVIIDGQWGSTGKGKLAGYIANREDIDVAVCDFQTNAGHTYVDDNGKPIMVQQIPSSFINEKAQICINAGSTFTLDILLREIETYKLQDRIHIHPHALLIKPDDTKAEKASLTHISSTQKGCGAALTNKIMRVGRHILACEEPSIQQYLADTSKIVQNTLATHGTVLIETAQGFDLSLNHGMEFPYTTSRDVTVMSALNNAGVNPAYLGNVWASLRTYPIRVGNVYDKDGKQIGWSGPHYPDQTELNWDEVTKISGSPERLEEITTVTKKVRRIFTFSNRQLRKFIAFNNPTHYFINFINYIDYADGVMKEFTDLSEKTRKWVKEFELEAMTAHKFYGYDLPKGIILGTGPKDSDMIEV